MPTLKIQTNTKMEKEILETPLALKRFISHEWKALMKASEAIQKINPLYVVIVARGASDNAGTFARYLIEKNWGIPVSSAAPSIHTLYDSRVSYKRGLVIGISQSGEGPDVCEIIKDARNQGALTIGLTNNPKSRLAEESEYVLALEAGLEQSVAATKTFTVQLMALYSLILCVSKGKKAEHELSLLPNLSKKGLSLSGDLWRFSPQFRYLTTCAVVGRGFHYGVAQELALKFKECCQVMAHSYSTADFHHGPKTLAGKNFPVFLLAPSGPTLKGSLELIDELNDRGATVVAFSPVKQVLDKAAIAFPTPAGNEETSPIGMAPMIHTFALAVAKIKGLDPDKPPFLKKITHTK
jgi:glucosamine--fructose-6-phosphate aminotransferase (isomerizing)